VLLSLIFSRKFHNNACLDVRDTCVAQTRKLSKWLGMIEI